METIRTVGIYSLIADSMYSYIRNDETDRTSHFFKNEFGMLEDLTNKPDKEFITLAKAIFEQD